MLFCSCFGSLFMHLCLVNAESVCLVTWNYMKMTVSRSKALWVKMWCEACVINKKTQWFYQNSAVLFTHLKKQTLLSINSASAFIYTEGKHICFTRSLTFTNTRAGALSNFTHAYGSNDGYASLS